MTSVSGREQLRGGVNMPMLDALAKQGLRHTRFHTTAL
jgi:arylsulfatase A-like enzyme